MIGPRRRRIVDPDPAKEVEDELAFHLEERVRDYRARGMDEESARAAALERLGDLERVRRDCTALLSAEHRSRRLRERLFFSWLDVKLGLRMLVRYPGLTMVGGLSMAFAIAVGAGVFQFVSDVVHPTLPLEDGDRIVELRLRHTPSRGVEEQAAWDFAAWRERLRSVEELGAYRTIERSLATAAEFGDPVMGAEITASAFRLTRVPPLLGRPLIDADEQPGAPAVVVIGHELWQGRFAGAPDVIGRTVRVGETERMVVGVMPGAYGFPVAHEFWVPLRLRDLVYGPREGPAIQVFGRLAPGMTLERAQAELTMLGAATAAERPQTHEHLQPEVLPYGESLFDVRGLVSLGLYSINLFFVLFLVLVCANVALLVFARTATRESELVVRTALGASRRRIVVQLFAEALVLGVVAAIVGLVAGDVALSRVLDILEITTGGDDRVPFWFHRGLAPVTVLYAAALTILAAAVAGVLPALKATGRGVQAKLREAATGRHLRFGGIWTGVIVTQVALTVVLVPIVGELWRDTSGIRSADFGFRAAEYVSARIIMDRPVPSGASSGASDEAYRTRVQAVVAEMERRLAAEPGVRGVTVASELPGAYHAHARIEVEGVPWPPRSVLGHAVQNASVAANFFEVLHAPIVSGRGFHAGDLRPDARVVVVNQSFVDRVMGGANPTGRRLRYLCTGENCAAADRQPGPWLEIVGVVGALRMTVNPDLRDNAGVYHPRAAGSADPIHLAIHVPGDPQSFVPRLQRLAAEVDPRLRLHEVQRMDQAAYSLLLSYQTWLGVVGTGSAILLLLALAGIYSIMAFTVSRRTREIGIRIALGASRRRIVAAVFSRAFLQVGIGLIAGTILFGGLVLLSWLGAEGGIRVSARELAVFLCYVILTTAICTLACVAPVRRALRIDPARALHVGG